MKRRLRYAMVGGGEGAFIGKVHREALRLDDAAELAAGVFNRDAAANARMGAALRLDPARVYADWETMLAAEGARTEDRIDFVVICTPNHLHYPIAKRALGLGFHVMCEKPLAMTYAEATDLVRLVDETKRAFGVMYTYTGYPMVKLARDLVAKGDIGRVCKVVVEYQQGSFRKLDFSQPLDKRNIWRMDPAQSGASCCMGDIGIHAFNLVEYVTGLRAASLLADLSSFAPGNGLDDDGSVLLRFEGGAKGLLVSSKIAGGEENGLRIRVYGEKKTLVWRQEDPNFLHVLAQRAPEEIWKRGNPYVASGSPAAAAATRTPAGHPEGWIEAFANHYAGFVAAIRGEADASPFPTVADGARGLAFVEAVLASNGADAAWREIPHL